MVLDFDDMNGYVLVQETWFRGDLVGSASAMKALLCSALDQSLSMPGSYYI